ncbi:DUF4326 domain-containing protein [Gordonia sihwensis]|uniref:DUF4326 domain-containing protein n=1 Tax=Gordonia sihwensis TaxID=173559 RepID=UPI003BF87F78
MPDGAIYVGRPSKWGNPYTAELMHRRSVAYQLLGADPPVRELLADAVEAFRCDLTYGPDSAWWWYGPHVQMIAIKGALAELRGHDLACWCPLDQPCHADVLLDLANGEHDE